MIPTMIVLLFEIATPLCARREMISPLWQNSSSSSDAVMISRSSGPRRFVRLASRETIFSWTFSSSAVSSAMLMGLSR